MTDIRLLWGIPQRSRRGPQPRFAPADVVRAAVEIADADGLDALSMRRLAERLGVAPMSLYSYVPGKDDLLDLMLDSVHGELAPPAGRGWRARLASIAREGRTLYLRHPWLLHVATGRPVLGPNVIARYEAELRAIYGLGLTDIEMDLVLRMVGDYVHGAARAAVDAAEVPRRTGMTDAQWWVEHGPRLASVLEPSRFPLASRVGSAAGAAYGAASDPQRSFDFGLARLLDGVGALVAARRARPRDQAGRRGTWRR